MSTRNPSRREFLKLAAIAAASTGLAACAPQPAAAPPAQAPKAEAPKAAPPPAAAVELQWWSFALGLPSDPWPHGKWEQQLANDYMKLHPEVTVAYQAMGWDSLTKLYTSIAAGNPPNLVLRGGIDQLIYAKQGDVLLAFDLPQELKDDLPAGWSEGMRFEGKNYMIPFYVLANGMVLNLTLCEQTGAMDLVPKAPERS